ncbi:helix-turn-helix domain-containing protein [Herbaspirillum sp. RV1423]|uniref:helix-turn-helix domain-containing protein n=1 Tax=Herbaspirillum sp. RV1423 TaxID=1443993 RepID=UPI0009DE6A8F|nr:helix-turn-helix domain-containing protein [Herbaspirillum sp. RV1423]
MLKYMIPKKQTYVVTHDPYTAYIREVLAQRGVLRHKQARIVADIVGLELVSVQQKFSGLRGWTRSQLSLLEQHFGRPGSPVPQASNDSHKTDGNASQWNAILKLSNIPQRCILQAGAPLSKPAEETLVAIEESEGWVVLPGSKAPEGKTACQVIHMTPLPAPRIAALDDRSDIPDGIAALFARQGIQVSAFNDVESLLEVVRVQPFEAYILDWSIDTDVTSEPAIAYIREFQKSNVPITILTGELRTQETIGSDIARMVELYKVSVLEKPAMLEILVKTFYNILFQIPGRN